MMHYRVELVRREHNDVIWRSEFCSYSKAEQIKRDCDANLNHDSHVTRLAADKEELTA